MELERSLSLQKTRWKNQFQAINSSKFHSDVGDIFKTHDFFKNLSCYQEVPVADLVPCYSSRQHRIDWYIDEFRLIIELHGKQHYELVNFSNKSFIEAFKDFNNIKFRDNMKKTALLEAGYEYVEISFKDKKKLSGDFLKDKIFENWS